MPLKRTALHRFVVSLVVCCATGAEPQKRATVRPRTLYLSTRTSDRSVSDTYSAIITFAAKHFQSGSDKNWAAIHFDCAIPLSKLFILTSPQNGSARSSDTVASVLSTVNTLDELTRLSAAKLNDPQRASWSTWMPITPADSPAPAAMASQLVSQTISVWPSGEKMCQLVIGQTALRLRGAVDGSEEWVMSCCIPTADPSRPLVSMPDISVAVPKP